jgi:LytS/YehU family sensor histidine kinase
MGMLVAPWVATAAVLRQRDARILQAESWSAARERQALDARLRLLQAQVEPHFPLQHPGQCAGAGRRRLAAGRTGAVQPDRLPARRRAAPATERPTRMGQELDWCAPTWQLMQLRMPDRLQFSVEAEPHRAGLRCPPMTLLTLVENAVQHGIDPSEEGGRIEVSVRRAGALRAR